MLTRTRVVIGSGVAVVAVLAAAAFGAWYFVIRDDAPAPVNLAGAVASLQETAGDGDLTGAIASLQGTATDGDLTGAWQLATEGDSFVGYRVVEQLATIGAQTAVGRTGAVTASLEFDGSAINAFEVEVDMTQLRSDDSRRDRALGNQSLETNTFPTSVFVMSESIVLAASPGEGETIAATAVGALTLHGVTRSVSIPLEGQLINGFVVVIGSLEIEFADYDIPAPRAFVVLSVEDHGTLEFQLIFEPA